MRMRYVALLALLLAVSPAFADEVADATAACDALKMDREDARFPDCVSAQRVRAAEARAIESRPAAPDPEAQQVEAERLRAQQQAGIDKIRSDLKLPQ